MYDSGLITHSIAVVWAGPDLHDLVIMPVLKAFHQNRSTVCQGFQVIFLDKLSCDIGSKEPSAFCEPTFFIMRQCPLEMIEWTIMRSFYSPLQVINLIEIGYVLSKASVCTKNSILNKCSNWKVVK